MRLSQRDLQAIIQTLGYFIGRTHSSLSLYGSRTDDRKKGGDIDLLLIVHDPEACSNLKSEKLEMLRDILKRIGDRKVDLLIMTESNAKNDSFVKMIKPSCILLKEYNAKS